MSGHASRELAGQTVVVIGGSSGIGLETARPRPGRGRRRHPHRPQPRPARGRRPGARRAGAPRRSTPPTRPRCSGFFAGLPGPIDHVLVTAGGPRYGPLLEMDAAEASRGAQRATSCRSLEVARNAVGKMRAGGTLLFMGGPAAAASAAGLGIVPAATAALPRSRPPSRSSSRRSASTSSPPASSTRPLSASLLGDQLEERRDELRATLPIGRVVGPADVAALAVHIMANTALTGATYDIDGGPAVHRRVTASHGSHRGGWLPQPSGARRAPRRRRRPGRRLAGRPGRARRRRCRPGVAGHGRPSGRSCTQGRSACRHRSRRSPPGRCRRRR